MIFGTPPIITNGLVLNLDAANMKSYPRSGTTWRDLSGLNNNGSLTNGPTFNNANGGSIVFDGVDDFVDLSSYANNLIFNAPATINVWFKPLLSKVSTQVIFEIGNGILLTDPSSKSFVLSYGDWTGGLTNETFVVSLFVNGNNTGTTTIYGVENGYEYQNQWVNCCLVINNNTWSMYLNSQRVTLTKGSFWGGANFSYGDSISPKNTVILGVYKDTSGISSKLNGNMSNFQLYNRALSPSEIQQNYNAQKSRFNLQ